MLKNFHAETAANVTATVCTASAGTELGITAVMLYGGATGGEITLTIAGFPQVHTVKAGETIYIDSKISLPEGTSVTVLSDTAGVHISVSAIEREV